MVVDYLLQFFEEVTPMEFYRDIFPCGSFQDKGDINTSTDYKGNGIIVQQFYNNKGEFEKCNRRIVTDDLVEVQNTINKSTQRLLTGGNCLMLMNGITYLGNRRIKQNACSMYAMIIEIDDLLGEEHWVGNRFVKDTGNKEHQGIADLFFRFEKIEQFPKPNYIVSSGSGIHLYYVFEKPIRLYPNVVKQLDKYRQDMITRMWGDAITRQYKEPQYESLFQAFRMVGTMNSKYDTEVIAFRYKEDKTTIEYLNEFARDETYEIDFDDSCNHYSLAECKAKFPDWYERRIVRKEQAKTWVCKTDLYYWWIRKVKEKYKNGAEKGHRFFCMAMLSVYACKCDIDEDTLTADLKDLYNYIQEKSVDEPLELVDYESALHYYLDNDSNELKKYTRKYVSGKSGIPIQANKRNGRKQKDHIRLMNFVRDEINQNTTWNKEGNGRKPKKDVVKQWRLEHPDGTKKQCKDETGMTYPTIRKWWGVV